MEHVSDGPRRFAAAAAVACAAFLVPAIHVAASALSAGPASPAGSVSAASALAAPSSSVGPGSPVRAPALAARPASPVRPGKPAVALECETPRLVIWLDTEGSGTAGSIFYHLEFTNLSAHRCTLDGSPFLMAVNLSGHQLGRRAAFDRALTPRNVTLRPGKTATALLRVVDVGNLPPSACRPVTAAGLKVYPPNQTRAKVIPFPFAACSLRSGPVYLRVRPVRK